MAVGQSAQRAGEPGEIGVVQHQVGQRVGCQRLNSLLYIQRLYGFKALYESISVSFILSQ
ncbi:hypothetical protein XAP6164_5880002 [Xanthomonas phaseoli pv. phaseoli]|nr:hypothetical protein XAP6164_5880002 [Xanthomonas phaseoli pv. phaseoli]